MSSLFWNCQGLGSPLTVLSLGDLLRKLRPEVIFLSETKGSSQSVEYLKRKWNLNGVGVSSVGLSGGLALLWRKNVHVSLVSYSSNHIDARVRLEADGNEFRCTGIYGYPEARDRFRTWQLMRSLHTGDQTPWFLGGDFNEILHRSEKSGGRTRLPGQMAAFNSTLSDCGLSDLGFEGGSFTWTNNRAAPATVYGRLDRVCANVAASTLYPTAMVKHIEQAGSDHIPILLVLERQQPGASPRRRRPFRFEAVWVRKHGCEEIVRSVWECGHTGGDVDGLLFNGEVCQARLLQWSRESNPQRHIDQTNKRLMELRRGPRTKAVQAEIVHLMSELETLYQDQTVYWQQRGKAAWMKEGDRNTAYFHAKATVREQVNKIMGLHDAHGVWVKEKQQMETVVDHYFRGIFKSSDPSEGDIEAALQSLSPRMTEDANHLLSQPFTPQEVKDAISCISPLKSPGPDGYPALFYHKYWPIIGSSVFNCVLKFQMIWFYLLRLILPILL